MDKPNEINAHRAGTARISATFKRLWSQSAGPSEACRCLGVLAGQQVEVADNWNKCIRSLWSRLVLSLEKTHTVEKRAQLASAIAVPNITFLARHCWPPLAVINRLHSLILEFIWGVRDDKRSRPWVPSEIASLPSGGLAVPCIRT